MSVTIRRIKRHKQAKQIIEDLADKPEHVLVIHYSCESFFNIKEGRTPRITSIAIRYLKSAQTKSFSIHKIAELENVDRTDIESEYDQLEKKMLSEYFEFLKEHKDYRWVHWNMRDINFGFEAIEHRFRVLGGTPCQLIDEKRIDIARVLIDRYGSSYIEHPRLEKLIQKNEMGSKQLLSGGDEAIAFDEKEYVKLHQSTLKKVDIIESILKESAEGRLKTNASLAQIYGLTPQGVFELVKDNWLWSCILSVIMLFLGIIIPKLMG